MKEYLASGRFLPLTAPEGGVVSGHAYKIGALLVIAMASVAAGEDFNGATGGVYLVSKPTDEAWSQGERIYWDDSAKVYTAESSGNTAIGIATADALTAAPTGRIWLGAEEGVPGVTDDLPEGSINLYFTPERVLAALTALDNADASHFLRGDGTMAALSETLSASGSAGQLAYFSAGDALSGIAALTPTGLLVADADGLPVTPADGPVWAGGALAVGDTLANFAAPASVAPRAGFKSLNGVAVAAIDDPTAITLGALGTITIGTNQPVALAIQNQGEADLVQSWWQVADGSASAIGVWEFQATGLGDGSGWFDINFPFGSGQLFTFQSDGSFNPGSDNAQDLGSLSDPTETQVRWRSGYFATSVVTPVVTGAASEAAPDAPASGGALYYVVENGKTKLYARFPTGAAQLVASEPA